MTRLERAGLALYFRNYAMLVEAARFLSQRARTSRAFWLLLVFVNRALLARFYRATCLSPAEARSLVRGAETILRARCICAPDDDPSRSGCLYLDDAARAYARFGPKPAGLVSAEEARALIEGHRGLRDDAPWLMTVTGRARCLAFPRRYVVCCCDARHCLVSALDREFPALEVVAEPSCGAAESSALRSALDHTVALLLGVPALLVWLLAYQIERSTLRVRLALRLSVLAALAGAAGSIISRPSMWPFLHWPDWRYNEDFALLLPLGAGLEVLALTGAIAAARWALRRPLDVMSVLLTVTRGLIGFEVVHLLRFAIVFLSLSWLEPSHAQLLFWAFDPVAYFVLIRALLRGLRR